MNNWIENPISYKITNPPPNKPTPILSNRVYRLLVHRGIEVIRILGIKKVMSYLYYDPKCNCLKCSNIGRSNSEWFRIRDIICVGIFNSTTIYILLSNQSLIFRVDTFKSAKILKGYFDSIIERVNRTC